MSKSFSSLSFSSLKLLFKGTTQQKKYHSLEFAESAQAISESLVGYIQEKAQIINTNQLQVDSVIYPKNIKGALYYNARAWVSMQTTGTPETPELLDVLSNDKSKVTLTSYTLLTLDQWAAQKKFMEDSYPRTQTEDYKSGAIWLQKPQSYMSERSVYMSERSVHTVSGKYYSASTPKRQTYQGNFTALGIKDGQEETRQKVLIAIDMLKLLKKPFKDGNDIQAYKLEVMNIQININEIIESTNQGKKGKKDQGEKGKKEEYPLLKIHTELKSLIDSIIQSTSVDKAESKENEKPPTDDKCIRESLQQLFLNQILPLLPKITLNDDLGETILALQKHGLLLVDLNNTDDYMLKIMTKMANSPELYSKDGLSSRICGFINTAHNSEIEPIIGLGSLKLARDNFLKQIIQLMIKDIDLISSNNSAYIKILLEAVNKYNSLINEMDSENNSENSEAGKTNHDGCGAGGSSGAGAGAKGKGPDFTEQQEKILKLAQDSGFEPTDPEEFVDSAENPLKMLWGAMVFLTKNNMNTPAGVIFGMLLKNEELTLENKRLTLENQRLTEQELAVPVAEAMTDTGAALPLTQPTSQGDSEPSAPPMPPPNATPFKEEAGKSGKEAPEVGKSDGPS